MARITERWPDAGDLIRGKSGRRVFDVDAGPTDRFAAQQAVEDQEGVTYGSEHDLDPTITVPPSGISRIEIRPGYYRVTANYEGNGTAGGSNAAIYSKKWQVLPPEIITAEVDVDRTWEGKSIFGSSLLPYDENSKRTIDWFRLKFRRYEPPSANILRKHLAFRQRFNSDAIELPVWGTLSPKELLFVSVTQVGTKEQGNADGVLVEYTMECRPTRSVSFEGEKSVTIHGWHDRRLDRAMKALVGDPTSGFGWANIVDIDGREITEPILMNGKGWPLKPDMYVITKKGEATAATPGPGPVYPASIVRESTGDAVFINYDATEGPIQFRGLNFQANM